MVSEPDHFCFIDLFSGIFWNQIFHGKQHYFVNFDEILVQKIDEIVLFDCTYKKAEKRFQSFEKPDYVRQNAKYQSMKTKAVARIKTVET